MRTPWPIYSLIKLLRFTPRWWRWRVYSRLCVDPHGPDGFEGTISRQRIGPHGCRIELALDNWMERFAYFTQSYYDPTTIRVLETFIGPKDWLIDVGANIGLVTLTGAHIVGAEGCVVAFEPNPFLAERLRLTLIQNKVANVNLHRCALGDKNETARLDIGSQHGTGNLRCGRGIEISVRKGDDLLAGIPPEPRILVKLDVEGYELHALKGMSALLRRPKTLFFIEITDDWLRQMGGSADAVMSLMRDNGYQALRPELDWGDRLKLSRISSPIQQYQYDLIFARPSDGFNLPVPLQ